MKELDNLKVFIARHDTTTVRISGPDASVLQEKINLLGAKTIANESGFLVELKDFFGPFTEYENGHTTAPFLQELYHYILKHYFDDNGDVVIEVA